jgi:hypothetical protein
MCNLNPWTGSSSPRRSDPRRHSGHLWHVANGGTHAAFRRHGGGDSPRDDRDAGSGDGPGGRGELSGGEYELRGSERGERRELGSGCSDHDHDDDRSGHCPQRDGDD